MSLSIPAVALLLTATFIVFATCILVYFPDFCTSGECGSEGVDNTAVFWSTDFFVGFVASVQALHLKHTTATGSMAGRTFLLVAIGFFFKGFTAAFFGNSGFDDGKGMSGYYVLTVLYHVCWVLAAVYFFTYFRKAWNLLEQDEKLCGSWQGLLFLSLVALSTLAMAVGAVANSIASPGSVGKSSTDNLQKEKHEATSWMRVVAIAQPIFSGCYGLFLICGASIFGGLTRRDDVVVCGLSSSYAAGGIVIMQVIAIGISLFHGLQLLDPDSQWEFRELSTMILYVIFNYVTMMTYYFLHNLVFAILPAKESKTEVVETDNDSDSSSNETDSNREQKRVNGVLLTVASGDSRSNHFTDDKILPIHGNLSTFRMNSFWSTSNARKHAEIDVRTVESRKRGKILTELFRWSLAIKPQEGEVTGRALDEQDANYSDRREDGRKEHIDLEEITSKSHSPDDAVCGHHGQTSQEEEVSVFSTEEICTIPVDFGRDDECTSIRISSKVPQHRGSLDENSQQAKNDPSSEDPEIDHGRFNSLKTKKRSIVRFAAPTAHSARHHDEGTTATKTDASIWNGYWQNVEFPQDSLPQQSETEANETEKKKRGIFKPMSKTRVFKSLKLFSFFQSEEEGSDAGSTVGRSTLVCDASIWNGRAEALEVPLGGECDIPAPTSAPTLSPVKDPHLGRRPIGLSSFTNEVPVQSDKGKPRHDPGFEIIYDEFVAE